MCCSRLVCIQAAPSPESEMQRVKPHLLQNLHATTPMVSQDVNMSMHWLFEAVEDPCCSWSDASAAVLSQMHNQSNHKILMASVLSAWRVNETAPTRGQGAKQWNDAIAAGIIAGLAQSVGCGPDASIANQTISRRSQKCRQAWQNRRGCRTGHNTATRPSKL